MLADASEEEIEKRALLSFVLTQRNELRAPDAYKMLRTGSAGVGKYMVWFGVKSPLKTQQCSEMT